MRALAADKRLPLTWALLPYVGTLIGLWVFDEALLAVGIYHAVILGLIAWKKIPRAVFLGRLLTREGFATCLLCTLTLPALYLLWPWMHLPGVELGALLEHWQLSGSLAWVFAIYSITLHPLLEETFWRGMLPDRIFSDLLFAGFHMLVLVKLIAWPWMLLSFVVLATGAFIWRQLARKQQGLLVPILSHALADLGVVLAVHLLLGVG